VEPTVNTADSAGLQRGRSKGKGFKLISKKGVERPVMRRKTKKEEGKRDITTLTF